jgi:uracil-DNA glycosylase
MRIQDINFGKEIENIFEQIKDCSINPIMKTQGFVPPYYRNEKLVKLIIIGQDPTIKNAYRRKYITKTLNLDKKGALKSYVESICQGLGISLDNVYATNLFKYFYHTPPAQTFDVLEEHLQPNLELLKKELSVFPKCPIITLGEPVLKLLLNYKAKVRHYWGYNTNTKISNGVFKYVLANDNQLNRNIYPFCHLPSIRKKFYKTTLNQYLEFVKLHF